MARGLKHTNYISSENSLRYLRPEPGTPEYEASLDGMEPTVQLLGGALYEEKHAPNYSDWLRLHST